MSFSQTDLTTALKTLSDRLPQFSEQQTRAGRMLRVVTERLSSHLNDNLKVYGINENLWFALMAVYVSPNSEILPSRLSDLMDLTRTSAIVGRNGQPRLGCTLYQPAGPPSDCAKIDPRR